MEHIINYGESYCVPAVWVVWEVEMMWVPHTHLLSLSSGECPVMTAVSQELEFVS